LRLVRYRGRFVLLELTRSEVIYGDEIRFREKSNWVRLRVNLYILSRYMRARNNCCSVDGLIWLQARQFSRVTSV